jgi:hypothetical protein
MGAALLRMLRWSACVVVRASAISCGGGSGGNDLGPSAPPPPPANSNVADVIVDSGPSNTSVNTLFTSVTLCVPGSTTDCQTIDHIQIDTASFGLRILAPVSTLSLPVQTALDGNPLLECTQFADGYSWGRGASGRKSAGIGLPWPFKSSAIQTSPSRRIVPARVRKRIPSPRSGPTASGIGVFAQDCGPQCVNSTSASLLFVHGA